MSEDLVTLGHSAPDFRLPAHDGRQIALADLRGKKVILYFYPKDDTPGCTTEGQEFTALYSQFQAADTVILGVSRDSLADHERFAAKYHFPFPLLSDSDEAACRAYGVLKEKNMYGKKSIGIERSTFVMDRDGRITHIERKIKAAGHAAELLKIVQQIP